MAEYAMRLPDIGEGIAEAEIVQWHVTVGDEIAEETPVVDVMTDKATVELPSPVAGSVIRLAGEIGDFIAVGAPLLWIDLPDRGGSAPEPVNAGLPEPAEASRPGPAGAGGPGPMTTDSPIGPPALAPASPSRGEGGPLAAPAVRRRAQNLGIDLATVPATREDGRVSHADLDEYLSADPRRRTTERSSPAEEPVQRDRLTGLRRHIARRMEEAHRIPHFTYVESVDVTELERLRASINDAASPTRPRLTLLPFLIRATVLAIADHPEMNARFDAAAGEVERFAAVHLGVATQTPNGLMVPVIRHAETRDISALAAEIGRLADRANDGSISLGELTGSTITLTSLGPRGGIMSTPIINSPEVAIIGVNRIVEHPLLVDGQHQIRRLMNLSSSFDHRVIDGWNAAVFIQRVKQLLETPALMLLSGPRFNPNGT